MAGQTLPRGTRQAIDTYAGIVMQLLVLPVPPSLQRVKRRRTQREHNESAFASTTDIQADIDFRRFGPIAVMHPFHSAAI
jgi:hypothetical protein